MMYNKNIYNHPDASKGRFGDSLIRTVDGEDAHVNAWEASVIDRHGADGEDLVKLMGSGTTNPYTGNKEYYDFFEEHIKPKITGTIDNIGKAIYHWWNETDKRNAAKGIVQRGMSTLSTQAGRYLGPDGFFADNMGLAMDKVSIKSNDALETISHETNKAIGKADMSSSGTIDYMERNQNDKVSRDYKLGVNEAVNERRQDEFNLMIDLETQKNQLLSDYTSTMEESYDGDFAAFDSMIDEYKVEYDSNPYNI